LNDNISLKPGFTYKTTNYYTPGLGSEEQGYPANPMDFFASGYTYEEEMKAILNNSVNWGTCAS
jgi:hypothetical protein